MIFGTDIKDSSYEVFRIRYSLNTDISEKNFKKYDKEIQKDLSRRIEEETNQIRFRTLNYVEEFLEKIDESLDEKLKELKDKDRLAYQMFIDEKKAVLKRLSQSTNEDKDFLIKKMANVDIGSQETDFRVEFLFSQILEQVRNTFDAVNYTLTIERFSRKKTQMSKVIKCFNAFFMIILRIVDLNRLWKEANEKDKQILEDLTYWDLDTMDKLTQRLPKSKTRRDSPKLLPDKDLINALWG